MNKTILILIIFLAATAGNLSKAFASGVFEKSDIELIAVIVDSDIGPPSALVQTERSEEQKLVSIGDSIVPGIKLIEVRGNGIIIQAEGIQRLLKLGQRSYNASVFEANALPHANNQTYDFTDQSVKTWINKGTTFADTLKNPSRIIAEGKFKGSVSIDFEPKGLWKNMRIKRGDIITEIGHRPVSSLDKKAIQGIFQNSPVVSVLVMRDGQEILITTGAI